MLNKTNTHEMKTEVEIYFDKELSDITFEVEALDEWKKICKNLGLNEQLSLTKGKESPIPFPYINLSMERVYSTLCPVRSEYKEYNKSPIPLEVIKQIAFCVKEKHFNKIEIWYDDKTPDPLVVGTNSKWYSYYEDSKRTENYDTEQEAKDESNSSNAYQTEVNHHLIARWGDVKRNFEELKEIAKERFIEKNSAQMKADIEVLTNKLKSLEENTTLYLLGEISESKAISSWM